MAHPVAWLILLWMLVTVPAARSEQGPAGGTDPVPIRRLAIPAERLAAELQRTGQGVVVPLPREEFEARLARAGAALRQGREQPRLLASYYRATLSDTALLGTAEWTIHSPKSAPVLLPLTAFSLAVRHIRLDEEEGILGDLERGSVALLLEKAGRQTAHLEWSARGDPGPGGIHFDLRIPPAAVSSFEVELPSNLGIDLTNDDCLLTGPFPVENAERRLWRIACSGRSQLDLVIQRLANDTVAPLVLGRSQARVKLQAGQLEAHFEYHPIEVLHRSIQELQFEVSPELAIHEVSIANLEIQSWAVTPASGSTPARLTVILREPIQGTLPPVRVRARAPLAVNQRWSCPWLRLVGAISRGDTIHLQLFPELALEAWNPGPFQLSRVVTHGDGIQELTLTATLSPPAGRNSNSRPSARLRLVKPQYQVRQLASLQVGPRQAVYSIESFYEVTRGSLFRTELRLPPDWELDRERLEVMPGDLLRSWSLEPGEGERRLLLEFQRPLEARQTARVTVVLHGSEAKDASWRLPDVQPEGFPNREGILGILPHPALQPVRDENRPITPWRQGGRNDGPQRVEQLLAGNPSMLAKSWDEQAPEAFLAFGGSGPEGRLLLLPRPAGLRAQSSLEILASRGRASLAYRVTLKPLSGALTTLDLVFSEALSTAGVWRMLSASGNQIRSVQAVPLGPLVVAPPLTFPAGPASQLAGLIMPPVAHVYRFSFVRPIQEQVTIEGSIELPGEQVVEASMPQALAGFNLNWLSSLALRAADASGQPPSVLRWRVPLLQIPAAENFEGSVSLQSFAADLLRVEQKGLRPDGPSEIDSKIGSPRLFRYLAGALQLTVEGHFPEINRPTRAVAEDGRLRILVTEGGRLIHHFRFRLQHWSQSVLPVRLPAGSTPGLAGVEGRWLSQIRSSLVADGRVLVELPVPRDASGCWYDLVYETRITGSWMGWIPLEEPQLPVALIGAERSLLLPRNLTPWSCPEIQPKAGTRSSQKGPDHDPLAGYLQDPGWTEWRIPPAAEPMTAIPLLHRHLLRTAQALAILLGLMLGQLWWSWLPRYRILILLLALCGAGLLWLWLPVGTASPPGLVCLGTAALFLVRLGNTRLPKVDGSSSRIPIVGATAGALVFLFCASPLGTTADRETTTVWLVTDFENGKERQTVYAPPELLTQIQNLSRAPMEGRRAPLLHQAVYRGSLAEGRALFEVELHYRVLNVENPILVPLQGIELLEASLNGKTTTVTTDVQARGGYVVRVKDPGEHVLRLRFTAVITQEGHERELRFSIPEAPFSRLELRLPKGVQQVQAHQARGAQVFEAGDPSVLKADLGRTGSLQVRWREEGVAQPTLLVQEHWLWSFQGPGGFLQGLLRYEIRQGTTRTLRVEIPESLAVQKVVLETPEETGTGPRLRDWWVETRGQQHDLVIETQSPLRSGVVVRLELVPRTPFAEQIEVLLPSPRDAEPMPAPSYLAFQARDLIAQATDWRRVTGIDKAQFREVWQATGHEDPGNVEQGYLFRRQPGLPPQLRLQLRSSIDTTDAFLSMQWRLRDSQAQWSGSARFRSTEVNLSLLQLDISPNLTVTRVRGPAIRSWSREQNRLSIWLQRSVPEVSVELEGRLGGTTPLLDRPLDLGTVRCLGVRSQTTQIHVAAEEGRALRVEQIQKLFSLPDRSVSVRELHLVSLEAQHGLRVRLESAAEPTPGRVLTHLEMVDDVLHFSSVLLLNPAPFDTSSLEVEILNWPEKEVRIEGAGPRVSREPGSTREKERLRISLNPAAPSPLHLQLRAELRVSDGGEVRVPRFSVPGRVLREFVTLTGPSGTLGDVSGMEPVRPTDPDLEAWPAATERLRRAGGSAWKVTGNATVRPRAIKPLPRTFPLGIIKAEQLVSCLDNHRWLHEAAWTMTLEAPLSLPIDLPPDCRLFKVELDGVELNWTQVGNSRVWLALPRADRSTLRLSWTTTTDDSTPRHPDLRMPAFAGATPTDTVWYVHVPIGMQVRPLQAQSLPPTNPRSPGKSAEERMSPVEGSWTAWRGLVPGEMPLLEIVPEEELHRQQRLLASACLVLLPTVAGLFQWWRERRRDYSANKAST